MHVVAYTDSPGVGGAEISLAHLVAGTAADVTVLGSSASVVERVAAGRPAYVAPLRDHPRLLARLRPDVVHANLAVPWAGSVGLAASFALPRTRTLPVEQLPLRTTRLPEWLRTRMIALLAGRPVVATRVGSVPEIVRDGETGLLVDSGDIRALADALSMLRDDPGRRARLGAAARARATARLTVGHMVAAYEALWDELLSAHRAPRLLVPRPRG